MSMIINPFIGTVSTPAFWTNLLGCITAVDAFHADGKVIKNAGTNAYDSGAFSVDNFSSSVGGILRWDVILDNFIAMGLSLTDIAGNNLAIAFAWESNAGNMDVRESGTFRGISTVSSTGKPREIRILPGGEVGYWLDGNTIYISGVTASGTYHVAVAIFQNTHYLERVRILPIDSTTFWWYCNNVSFASDGTHSDGRLTRTLSGGSWGASGARSRVTFVRADNKSLTWVRTATINSNGVIVGIDDRTYNLNGNFQSFDMPFSFIAQSGSLLVWENSSQKASTTAAAGDLLEIRVSTAGAVTYWKNGSLIYTSLTTVSAGVKYWASCAVFDNGLTVDGVDLV